jgi:putative heme-binding domain-containing protein
MRDAGISAFLKDADEQVVTEAARAINDDLSIVGALPALGDLLNTTSFSNEALLRRAINANLRVGTDKAMQNLLDFARQTARPVEMRAESLAALSTWAKPSVLDRVDGRYRGKISRPEDVVKRKSQDVLLGLLNSREAGLRLAVVKAIGKLKIVEASAPLMTLLKRDADPEVRSEALKALAVTSYPQIGDAIQIALEDKEKNVRVTALDLLPKMNIPEPLMVSLLADVIDTRTTEEKQTALLTLGTLPAEHTGKVLEKLLGQFENKKLPADIQLELAEAIDSTHLPDLKQRYKSISTKQSTDTLTSAYAGALYGGNARRGAGVFYSNQAAQCIRCHSYGDYGGNAGPRLNGVAARLTRDQLLEALINPSARMAPGYGMVTIELQNGKKLSGILQLEKTDQITLKIGSKPDTVINRSQIVKRTDAASSMPPMKSLLTKKEIRDVVSFLATMKEQ